MPEASSPRLNPICTFVCSLCLEEEGTSEKKVTLSACSHDKSCKDCLVKWIQKEECSSQSVATCPFCRVSIVAQDVFALLGREFEPRRPCAAEELMDVGAEGVDELTLHWLRENTKVCEGCGYNVEKESGCDLIICLCGWRFCFNCGEPGGDCDCNPGHDFDEDEEYPEVEDGPIMRNGVVDMRACIRRRVIRRQREWQLEDNDEEAVIMESMKQSHEAWLFLNSPKDLQVLEQLTCKKRFDVRWARNRKVYGEKEQLSVDECISSGEWLFNHSTRVGSLNHLVWLSKHSQTAKHFNDICWHENGGYFNIYGEVCQYVYCRHCPRARNEKEYHSRDIEASRNMSFPFNHDEEDDEVSYVSV